MVKTLPLQILSWLESECFCSGGCDLLTGAGITTDAAFSGLDDKHSETSKLDAFTILQSLFHRIEQRFDGYLCFNLRNTCLVGHLVDNVELDHMSSVRLCE